MVLASLSALLMAYDSQTEEVFFQQREATAKQLSALWVLVIVASITAGFQLLQICKCLLCVWLAKNPCGSNKTGAWICFFLDQAATYATFTATAAAGQAASVALLGVGHMQWSKLCNVYHRFCEQAGGSILCGLVASLAMAVVSSVSAYQLFQLYPSPDLGAASKSRKWATWVLL